MCRNRVGSGDCSRLTRLLRHAGSRALLQCPGLSPPDARGSTAVDTPDDHDFPPQIDDAAASSLPPQQIAADAEQVEQLDRYRRLLWSWNERMNLTRHTTLEKFVGRDVVDSLQLAKLLGARRAGARRRHRRRRAGRRAGDPAARSGGQPLRIDAKEGPGRRGDRRRAGAAGAGLSPAGPKKCCEITTFDTLVARALAPLAKVLDLAASRIGTRSTGCCSSKARRGSRNAARPGTMA